MGRKLLKSLLPLFLFASTTIYSSVGISADDENHFKYFDETSYTKTVQTEMKELESAYKTATSEKVSQGDAEKARQKAIELSRHILHHLNNRNANIDLTEGGALTATEVVLNIQVMGRLLDILAAEHQPHQDRWEYTW